MIVRPILSAIAVTFFATALAVKAEVRLPRILGSHMVLQRDLPIHIWGWSDPGENVSVALEDSTQTTSADDLGRWSVYLPPQHAGGPFQITVSGTNRIVLDDVLIGDVWFASGQSNMEMPLRGFPNSAFVNNAAEEIAHATQPNIRLLNIGQKAFSFPLTDYGAEGRHQEPGVSQSWTVCSPETAAGFSAAAYFFGRDLVAKEHVPIGLIDSSWGGTPAEAWTSLDGISSDAGLMPVFAAYAHMMNEEAELPLVMASEKRADTAARSANQTPPKHPWRPNPESWAPAWLFNGMVSPALDFPIKGVIWYQGESNADPERAPLYAKLFPALISDWRTHWHEGNFPFLFVQIANFNAGEQQTWPIVREAQRRTLSLANTAMAVTIDIGTPDNVHPSDKQTVGARLALAARAIAYGEDVEYSGPMFRQVSAGDGSLRVWFDHAEGLVAKGGTLEGFEIAGEDHHFVTATASIDGPSVLVTSPQVAHPKFVRYGWRNAPVVNLFNSAGLPASPFTSEDTIPAS